MDAARDLTPADLTMLLERCQHRAVRGLLSEWSEDGTDDYDGGFRIVDGDLVVEGDLDLDDEELAVLVVCGDLTVGGLFRDACDDGPTVTVVLGTLRARDVVTAGLLEVHGDLVARQAVVGDYNDGGALVLGDLVTDPFLPVDIVYEVRGQVRAEEAVPPFTTELSFVPQRLAPRFYAVKGAGAVLFAGEGGDGHVAALAAGESIVVG
jgi:hypothetical protein